MTSSVGLPTLQVLPNFYEADHLKLKISFKSKTALRTHEGLE